MSPVILVQSCSQCVLVRRFQISQDCAKTRLLKTSNRRSRPIHRRTAPPAWQPDTLVAIVTFSLRPRFHSISGISGGRHPSILYTCVPTRSSFLISTCRYSPVLSSCSIPRFPNESQEPSQLRHRTTSSKQGLGKHRPPTLTTPSHSLPR